MAKEDKKPASKGSQREKAPGFGEESGMGDLLSAGLRYGLPLAYLGASQAQVKKLRKQAKPELTSPNLMTGAVRDMPRPNFGLPPSPERGGSSLAEFMNAGVQRDAFQRNAELDFEYKNALNRQGQENQILDRTNQQAMIDAQIQNQEELSQASLAANELLGYAIPDRTSTIESIFHNLDRDVFNAGVVKDTKEISFATEVIRNPDRFSPEEVANAKATLSGVRAPIPSNKRGGKLRKPTKFSVAY